MRIHRGWPLALAMLMILGCAEEAEDMDNAPPVDLSAEQVAVNQTLDQFQQIMVNEDMELMDRVFAHDPDLLVFGTDAPERWVGYDAFRASVEKQFSSFDDMEVVTRDRTVHVHSSGQVAWFSEVMDWRLTAGGEPAEMTGLRFTGVLEKRNDSWVFVQAHVSVPVSGQAVAY